MEKDTESPDRDANAEKQPSHDEAQPLEPAVGDHSQPKKQFFKRKPVIIGAAALLVLLVGAGFWLFISNKPDADKNLGTEQKQNRLGATTTVVDGKAEISSNQKEWAELKVDTDLEQGNYIRSAADGRVIITLDDGSAIRVNSASTVRLASLDADNIIVRNISGEVYTRVVKSERTFNVQVGEESYTALGTAYKTINTEATSGVEVYQSEVSVKVAKQTVGEGKRYFDKAAAAELSKKVTDIPLDQLQKDAFLQWNLDHDKKSSDFKDKLGYLEKLAAQPPPAPAQAASSSFTVSGAAASNGVNLTWKISGISASSFKVLVSKEGTPVYGGKNTEAASVKDPATRSYLYKSTTGKAYYFRICAYNGSACSAYSNTVQVTAPYVAPTPPSGTISLTNPSGASLSWTISGSAPYGLKLVWSTTANPTYPGSSAKYFDGSNGSTTLDDDPGTYYARICMYYEGTCQNYSNEVTVTVP